MTQVIIIYKSVYIIDSFVQINICWYLALYKFSFVFYSFLARVSDAA